MRSLAEDDLGTGGKVVYMNNTLNRNIHAVALSVHMKYAHFQKTVETNI